jgi:hypothetical protein
MGRFAWEGTWAIVLSIIWESVVVIDDIVNNTIVKFRL